MPDLVSIITPVYNGEAFVAQAIDSVLAQSHSNWELWIVNDGSIDNTKDAVAAYLSDPRINYVEQPNQGVSAARNTGLNKMRGDWFITLDADDYLPPRSIESRLNLAKENADLTFIDGNVTAFTGADPMVGESWTPHFEGQPQRTLIHDTQRCFVGTTWMVKKPADLQLFPAGMTHAEDLYFYIVNSGEGLYGSVNETVYCYRRGESSAMSNLAGLEKGYLELFRRLKEGGFLPEDEAEQLNGRLKRIMYRSWLKAGKPLAALRSRKRFDQLR